MGKIIVFDGMDGTGKHTQAEIFYNNIKSHTDKVCLFSFPNYNSDSSYFVRQILNNKYNDIKNPYTISLAYLLDMSITYQREIKEKYEDDYIIILDRYFISNVLYQLDKYDIGQDKMLFIDLLCITANNLDLPTPDCTILFDSEPEVSDRLLNNRYNVDISKRDKNENIETQLKVHRNIEFISNNINSTIIRNLGEIHILKIHDENGNVYSIEEIANKLYNRIYYTD